MARCGAWGSSTGARGSGASSWLWAWPHAPLTCNYCPSPRPGTYPAADLEDVDGRGKAPEPDGTRLPVPTASASHRLAVPGAVPASPRYGSAQARSLPPGVPPPDGASTGKFIQPYGASHLGWAWAASRGDMCAAGDTPGKAGEVVKAFSN